MLLKNKFFNKKVGKNFSFDENVEQVGIVGFGGLR
jgi:hypothetical protein